MGYGLSPFDCQELIKKGKKYKGRGYGLVTAVQLDYEFVVESEHVTRGLPGDYLARNRRGHFLALAKEKFEKEFKVVK